MAAFASNITLLATMDSGRIEIDREAAKISALVNDALDDDEESPEVPVMNVSTVTLQKIADFMMINKETPLPEIAKPVKSANMNEIIPNCPKIVEYLSNYDPPTPENLSLLYDLIIAADYMNVKPLLEATCAKMETFSKNKSPAEVKTLFTEGSKSE